LERHSELNAQFQSYQLDEILFSISLITGETIKPDSSVYEDMPNLAVLSLLVPCLINSSGAYRTIFYGTIAF
jgi:hypothetical protein